MLKILSPVPATVPGKKKAQPKPGGDTRPGAEHAAVEDQGSPASFSRHKSALAAKLSNVGSKGRPSPKQSPDAQTNLTSDAPEKVLVIPIHDSPSELLGLSSEEAVMRKNSTTSSGGKPKMNFVGFDDNSSFRDGGSVVGEVLEKRTRFSLSHDEGSIGNTSDNLEAISEAASNHSVASSLEDEVDPVEDPIIDNLSDMVSANVSGRGTPNVSGRDTPSSQVTEEDEPGGGQAQAAEPPVAQVENLIEERQRENNVLSRRKNGEPDMEERFGRFEIKPELRRGRIGQLGSTGTAGDRDEAVSMVSDTWSTDVLSSDTETIGEPPTLEDLLRGRPGDEFHNQAEAHNRRDFLNRARNLDHLAVPNEGSLSHNNSGSAISSSGQLLDVLETNSEAWSMDVLASDTESFRMRDFDPDDSLSMARSDDTRFTDDTTRSDPDQMLQRLELNEFEDGVGPRGAAAVPEPARVFQPIKNAAVEQWAELSRANNTSAVDKRRDSDASANSSKQESILKKPHINQASNLSEPCLVNLDESATADGCNSSVDNFSIGTGDMSALSTSVRLSTTSIASSASSHGSVTSVEALPSHTKSRSNSNASAATSGGGGYTAEEPKVNVSMASTGAIPKSISFDKSADKDEEGETKAGAMLNKRDRNFFKNWKLPKIGRNRGGGRGPKADEYRTDRLTQDAFNIPEHSEGPVLHRSSSDASRNRAETQETSDDILAKYRKPQQAANKADHSIQIKPDDEPDGGVTVELDVANLEASVIFEDAKRKLRLMLSEVIICA